MNKIMIILFIGLLNVSFSEKETYSLKINISQLRNSKGDVIVYLYNKEGTIPDKKFNKYYKKRTSAIDLNSSTVIFSNLPKGNYAVCIVHDENNNGELDKGFIFPKEGIGFSKYESINLRNRPNFLKASFNLDSDISVDVKTIYM